MIKWSARLIVVLMSCLLSQAAAQSPSAAALSLSFCETAAAFDTRGCRPQRVELPHNWKPSGTEYSFGLYRLEIPRPVGGNHALLLDRLTLDGALRVDGRMIIDKLDPQRVTRQRYWPLMASFSVEGDPAKPLVIEVAVRGHPASKSGIGNLTVGTLDRIDQQYRNALAFEILLVAALAAASLLAGIVGLLIGQPDGPNSRMLMVTSWLAVFSGLRCLHNLVTEPPFDVILWQQFGLWLLALVGLLGIQVAATSIENTADLRRPFALAAIAVLALLLLPAALVDPQLIVNAVFVTITCVAMIVIGLLVRHVYRKPEPLGIGVLTVFGLMLVTGIHDLAVHFGRYSLSGNYVQTWSLPAVIILAVVALARRAATQREVELALQRATSRREDLLRDLHDRVGSRLVALAFHAQKSVQDPAFIDEIKSLINEVRMIQSAVSTEATTLDSLLADLRHLYSRIGGGQFPLRWESDEIAARIRLSADQAIAVVRIIEEAIANAIKHSSAKTITLRVSAAPHRQSVVLEIIDDGEGDFLPTASGGLANMKSRAAQAELDLQFRYRDATDKAVHLVFPNHLFEGMQNP
ncbi:MAG: hypothetical protein FJ154_03530 [Gammaproteobacteria bacterium]|nr:hypothetical protein [Gammaproteobacteria bacterium]